MRAVDRPPADLRTGSLGTRPPARPAPAPPTRVVLSDDEYKDQTFKNRLDLTQTLKRIQRMAYDYSNPVDENIVIPALTYGANANPLVIQPDYDRMEIYTTLVYSLPLGCTSASLLIGTSRVIPLYSGTALTIQQLEFQSGLTMLAGPDDKRQLDIQGVLTTAGYLGLMGHCFERDGKS